MPKDEEVIEKLAESIEKYGLLHPLGVSKDGKLATGSHRLEAWKKAGGNEEDIPKITLDIDNMYDILAVRQHENQLRREISREEVEEELREMADFLEENEPEKYGTKDSQAKKIAEDTPYTESTVRRYLEEPKLERTSRKTPKKEEKAEEPSPLKKKAVEAGKKGAESGKKGGRPPKYHYTCPECSYSGPLRDFGRKEVS